MELIHSILTAPVCILLGIIALLFWLYMVAKSKDSLNVRFTALGVDVEVNTKKGTSDGN